MATYDVHFPLLDASAQEATGKAFTFGYKSAVAITGPQKMINRFVQCLLTTKGSDPFDRTYGTQFNDLFGSNVSETQHIVDVITLAIEDCVTQMQAMDRTRAVPDNERLRSATFAGYSTTGRDNVSAVVQLSTVSGERATLTLPAL